MNRTFEAPHKFNETVLGMFLKTVSRNSYTVVKNFAPMLHTDGSGILLDAGTVNGVASVLLRSQGCPFYRYILPSPHTRDN